jgi:hypothetical protein
VRLRHTVELCRSADLPELFSLFADWYKHNPRMSERDFFDWQFRDTPLRLSAGEYDFLLLRSGEGKIVGCLGFVGFEFWRGPNIEIGGWTHNWYGEGEAVGGLDLMLRFMALVDNRFMIRLTEQARRVYQLLKIPLLPAIPRWWAAIDAGRLEALFGLNAEDLARATGSAELLRRNDAAAQARPIDRLEPQDEFFWDRSGSPNGVRRTGRYLNWRYVDIPRHDYRVIRTERGLGVYRVETIMHSDASVIRLLEWTFDAEETAGALATVLEASRHRNPVLVDFHCTSHAIGERLTPFGFVAQDATRPSVPDLFRPTHRSGGYAVALDLPPHRTARTVDWDGWYITIGDSDVDRVKL